MRAFTTELFHNLAVCCWVCANSVWMIGEFYYDDTTRPAATVFFVGGVLVMAYYYSFIHFRRQDDIPAEEPVKADSYFAKTPVEVDEPA